MSETKLLDPSEDCCPGFHDGDAGFVHSTGCTRDCKWCGKPMEESQGEWFCSRECSLANEGKL